MFIYKKPITEKVKEKVMVEGHYPVREAGNIRDMSLRDICDVIRSNANAIYTKDRMHDKILRRLSEKDGKISTLKLVLEEREIAISVLEMVINEFSCGEGSGSQCSVMALDIYDKYMSSIREIIKKALAKKKGATMIEKLKTPLIAKMDKDAKKRRTQIISAEQVALAFHEEKINEIIDALNILEEPEPCLEYRVVDR